jgi:uncharacterized protein with HEPN domain
VLPDARSVRERLNDILDCSVRVRTLCAIGLDLVWTMIEIDLPVLEKAVAQLLGVE